MLPGHIINFAIIIQKILYSRKFSPGENFHQFHHLVLMKFCSVNFLSCVNDCIDYIATFTALAKFIPLNISVIQKVPGLGEFLSREYFRLHVYGIIFLYMDAI